MDIGEVAQKTREAVRNAGKLILRDWDKPRDISYKGHIDLVTSTDLAVEKQLKADLQTILPGADFLAEETDANTEPGELTWIIDPLDGTTNFAHGFPFVATSVALWRQKQVCLGIVYLPILDELFEAVLGQGAWLNGKSISVSSTKKLKQSLVATGFPYDIDRYVDQVVNNLGKMLTHAQGVRRPGSAAIDLAFTACGRYDGFYESTLKPWDTAAGWLLVREAGGQVTQYEAGKPYKLGAQTILASNGHIHREMSSLLRTNQDRR